MEFDKTTVYPSDASPTGYMAHFVLDYDGDHIPAVTGDWMFSEEHYSSRFTAAGYWPHQWRPGCFAHKLLGLRQTPRELLNNTAGEQINPQSFDFDRDILRLGIYPMVKNQSTGLWEKEIPLPGGVYNYRFILDMPEDDPVRMVTICDRTNPPLVESHTGAMYSQISVPFDPARQTEDRSFELPCAGAAEGRIVHLMVPSVSGTDADNEVFIYLPWDYDEHRRTPYPVLYLSHGGGGNASSWLTEGALKNIMDRRIHEKKAASMLVVMMDNEYFHWDNKGRCIPYLLDALIPYIEKSYNVRCDRMGRAFAGFSAGGFLACDICLSCPSVFGAVGIWSGGRRGADYFDAEACRTMKIHIGAGHYDDAFYSFSFPLEDELSARNIAFTSYFPPGGHQWSVWRRLLDDFVTRVFMK